jgi:putative toxin-antitoxin system antitoxin component (TIGR02293 family)
MNKPRTATKARKVRRSVARNGTRGRIAQKSEPETAIIARATEVIGDKRAALRWMGTPVRALDYATPISLLNNQAGRNAVLGVLTRIEHGVL